MLCQGLELKLHLIPQSCQHSGKNAVVGPQSPAVGFISKP